MGFLSHVAGALFGIADSADHGGYTENSDCLDYGNGADAARSLGWQQEEDASTTHTATLRAGRTPGYKDHLVTVEHNGLAHFGDTDIAELAGEYEARNVEAFTDGFADERDYQEKPGVLRSIFGFFENHNL